MRPTGIEPVTPSLEGSCSIRLSYGRKSSKYLLIMNLQILLLFAAYLNYLFVPDLCQFQTSPDLGFLLSEPYSGKYNKCVERTKCVLMRVN